MTWRHVVRNFFLVVLVLAAPKPAWCFPEMVRYGYINCNTCHVSPDGGGVLTQYGREISREILSTWGEKNEQESMFAWGVVAPPDWLDTMGMYRGAYAYQNTPYISQGKYIYMQGDIEGAANYKKFTFDATLGYENKEQDTSALDHLISRRHYIMYKLIEPPTKSQAGDEGSQEGELELRFGRFFPEFGINTPDHIIPIKRDLNWDEGQETYNLEAGWITDKYSIFLTGIFGRPDHASYHREEGFALKPSIAIEDTYKVGVSYEYGTSPDFTRNVGGPWGILGFSKHFFLLSEWDLQQQTFKATSTAQTGGVDYNRLDYELIQGLHVYLTQDYSQLNFSDFSSTHNSYGVGVQFFPRPHFEVNASYQRLRQMFVGNGYYDYAWLMINIYI